MEFQIIRNDVSIMAVDAIVLPANKQLHEGSGTSKAIFERAGRKICKRHVSSITPCMREMLCQPRF